MLHFLFDFLFDLGLIKSAYNLFTYISFRSSLAMIVSLFVTIYFGKYIIQFLNNKSAKDEVRDLGLEGQTAKTGTPTMGGIIILVGILIPTILLCRLDNIYVIIMLITTVWMSVIGFLDDYIKVYKNKKQGLAGSFKVIGQVGLGLIVAAIMLFHPDIVVRENINNKDIDLLSSAYELDSTSLFSEESKSLNTTIPFFKHNQLNYDNILFESFNNKFLNFLLFTFIVVFIITAVSNSANLTDGIDGLATGSSAIIGSTLGLFAYVSGNMIFANYLDIMYIPNVSELVVFMSAFVGSCVGFLWYNSYPAQVFMGDTGSLSLGGIIGVLAILIRKELLIPIFCGLFFIESLSVLIQVFVFKYTRYKYGSGKRVFLMSPLHHHFQKKGIHESKIVTRFWILCVFLCLLAFVTLKIR